MHNIDYRYLRPLKAESLRKWYEEPFAERTALSVWRGQNAAILPLKKFEGEVCLFGRGGVVDAQGDYVSLSGIEYRIWGGYSFDAAEYHDEKVVFCGYLINHWGHFLVEAVARLWYALENDPSVDKYVFFLEENAEREVTGNFREFLKLLNIWDKVEFVRRPTTYREVIVPELAFLIGKYYSPRFLAVFDAVAEHIAEKPEWKRYDKVYFSRGQLAKNR